jgi:lysophospholipase L1-like esterase
MKTSLISRLCVLAALIVAVAPASISGQVDDPDPARFDDAIRSFTSYDAKNSFPADATLFVGSSSIVFWQTGERFPGMPLINRGFGGSHMSDVVHFVEETVIRYAPRTVVHYAGDNDTAAGKRAPQLLEDFQAFSEAILEAEPSTRIIFLSIKPSISRWDVWPEMQEANALIKAYTETDARLDYVDVATGLLGSNGEPRPELFRRDGLHLSPAGYDIWDEIMMEVLMPGHMRGAHGPDHGAGHGAAH